MRLGFSGFSLASCYRTVRCEVSLKMGYFARCHVTSFLCGTFSGRLFDGTVAAVSREPLRGKEKASSQRKFELSDGFI